MTTTAPPGSRQAHREASERDKRARRFLLRLSLANWGIAVVAWTVSAFLGITSPASIMVYSVLFVIGLFAVVVALLTFLLEKFAHTPEQLASVDAEPSDEGADAGDDEDDSAGAEGVAAAAAKDAAAAGPKSDAAPAPKASPRRRRPEGRSRPEGRGRREGRRRCRPEGRRRQVRRATRPRRATSPPRATLRLPPRADRDSTGVPGSASASKPALFARLVKIEHSVYALPFAYAGAFLAADGMPTWAQLVWITVAMVGARSAAMALNRLIDAELDARNPRTADARAAGRAPGQA